MRLHWKYIDLSVQWNIRFLELKIGVPWTSHWIVRVLVNSPVTVTSQLAPLFVKKSTFTSRYIVHPTGGGAAKLVCESCGAEYPYVVSPSRCAFCAVMKESGVTICIAHRSREWRWSDWGWAIKHDGYYVGEEITQPMPAIRPTRFKAKHKALAVAFEIEKQEWALELDNPKRDYEVVVEPYPIKPVQPARPDPVIMASIFSGQPGIGARLGTLGRKRMS
jgi:hypothetical protein